MSSQNEQPATDKAAGRISVVYRLIASLQPDTKNPRRHSPRQVRQIARSIDAFGFNVPVLINEAGKVIAGHGRVMACRELGWTQVPTVCLAHLSAAQAKAFMIADNRLTETSAWDDALLAEQLHELCVLDLDFSLEATGFTMGEIDLRIEAAAPVVDAAEDPADVLPVVKAGPPVSKPGDLWSLGRHRILCASALEAASYASLMQDEQAAVVFTDPPYNVPIDGHASGLGATRHRDFAMACGEMSAAEFTAFLTTVCRLLATHSADGALQFICMDWRHIGELIAAGTAVYTELKNVCVWVKHNAGMGSLYRSQHELVFVFKHGREAHRNNIELGRFGRHRSNVWNYRGINYFGQSSDEGNLLALHPTVKPVNLVADAILDCSARDDVILDAFLGSGTSVIAAERTGRRCRGLEIDRAYVDTIIKRWQAFTGDHAVHVASGRSFDDLQSGAENV
jgi:DNA modification methylase